MIYEVMSRIFKISPEENVSGELSLLFVYRSPCAGEMAHQLRLVAALLFYRS